MPTDVLISLANRVRPFIVTAVTKPSKIRSRATTAVAWLAPVTLAWGTLIFLSHQPGAGPVIWTNRLIGWTIAITALCIMGGSIAIYRTSRLAMFRWIAFYLALGIIWLGLELVAALNLVSWRIVFDRVTGQGLVNRPYTTEFLFDRELDFRRPPGAEWSGPAASDIEWEWSVPPDRPRTLSFQYDRDGYRNPANLSRADVALVGDSFVEGWFVRDEETTARLLESQLRLPVANLGVAGYGTARELRVLRKESARLKPAVIVWFFFEGNDFYDDLGWELNNQMDKPKRAAEPDEGKPLRTAKLWRQRSFACNVVRLVRRWIHPLVPNRAPFVGHLTISETNRQPIYFASYASVPWSDWLDNRWEQSKKSFEEGNRFCRDNGIRLLLCYVPIKFRVYREFVEFASDSPCPNWDVWTLPKDFADFCRTTGIPFIDFTAPLTDAIREGKMPYAPTDSHWGPDGHRLAAEILRDEFRRRNWFSTGQRTTPKE